MNAEKHEIGKDAEELNALSGAIIGCAIEVHRTLGPGSLESIYEEALVWELRTKSVSVERQVPVPVYYKESLLGARLRLDLLVEGGGVVECKAKEQLSTSDKPQLLSYLRVTNLPLGLLINFHEQVLKNGLHRIVNYFPSSLSVTSATSAPQRS